MKKILSGLCLLCLCLTNGFGKPNQIAELLKKVLGENADEEKTVHADFEEWHPQYNHYIRAWLSNEIEQLEDELKKLEDELAEEGDEGRKKKLKNRRGEKAKKLESMRSRLGMGNYFQFKTEADLPPDLDWENGLEQPEIGDPKAKKGGTFRYFISSFFCVIRF